MTIYGETRAPTILTLCNSDDRGLLLCLLLLLHTSSPAWAQFPNAPDHPAPVDQFSKVRLDKSMAIILVIVVVVFFAFGFVSVYTRQCAERRFRATDDLTTPMGSSNRQPRGLDSDIIHGFPTFVYSAVKGLKIGRSTLECAVCLNEFQDHETLRFIPKCSHVFHAQCIDLWLSSHSTCPVCRANLASMPGDASSVAIQISDSNIQPQSEEQHHNNASRVGDSSPNQNRPWRSRSTGLGIASRLFPRSHSTGHSLVSAGENRERFTLRLPEEVRMELLNSTLNRTKSCVTFRGMSSERRGFRTRSVGFTWTPPFISRSRKPWNPVVDGSESEVAMDNLEERSCDRLCPQRQDGDIGSLGTS